MIAWPAKDPSDVADFTWLPTLDDGDVLASFVPAVSQGTITLDSEEFDDDRATIWIRGGAHGELAIVTMVITTDGGRTFRDAAVLPVFDRATEAMAVFRVRYPEFASKPDSDVGYRLWESLGSVDDSWPADSVLIARATYAAHALAAAPQPGMPAGVTSFKSADFSASFSEAAASRVGLDATSYGREFKAMQRRFFGGPMLIGGGCVR